MFINGDGLNDFMSTGWLALGITVAGAIVAAFASWHRRNQEADFGTVSTHWIAEQRAGQRADSER
ncbi:MAG: hypothetical protein ABI818_05435 [Acidobacteriota bacterium]